MAELLFYSRPDCHLCDQAMELLTGVAPSHAARVVDIDDDVDLLERYGLVIPVLRRADTGAELNWPFDAARLLDFLGGG